MLVARTRVVGHFVHAESARRSFAALRRGLLARPSVAVWVKPHRSVVEIAYTAADARAGLVRGLALGGLAGFLGVGGLALVVTRALGAPMGVVWLAMAMGLLAGALAGAAYARPAPHPALAMLDADEAPTITVETTDDEDREWAADVLVQADARVERGRTRLEDRRRPALRHA